MSDSTKCIGRGCFNSATCADRYCGTCCRRNCHHRLREYSARLEPRRDPRGSHGYLGFEFEFVAKARATTAGGARLSSTQALRGIAKVVTTDGSVHNDVGAGAEAKLLVWCDRAARTVRGLCERLRIANTADVNHTCGLHVHLDARGLPQDRRVGFARAMMVARDDWMRLVSESRRGNRYVNASDDIYDRYAFVNSRRYTVEFRLHPGTVNPHKAYGWACVCSDLLHFMRDESCGIGAEIGPQNGCFGADAREYIAARVSSRGRM